MEDPKLRETGTTAEAEGIVDTEATEASRMMDETGEIPGRQKRGSGRAARLAEAQEIRSRWDTPPVIRQGSVLWHGLDNRTARLYALLRESLLGRLLTSYRRSGSFLMTGEGRAESRQCRPLSERRCRVVRAVEGSGIIAAVRRMWAAMADCPVNLYGLFLLIYGILGILIQILGPLLLKHMTMNMGRLLWYIAIAAVVLPLALTEQSLAGIVGSGRLGRWLMCDLLGIPPERLEKPRLEVKRSVAYPAVLCLVPVVTMATLRVHPLVVPLIFLGVAVLGVVVTRPESGVILSAMCLPLCWMWSWGIWCLLGMILLTWVGYGFKLLCMQRTFRLGRLDVAVILVELLFFGDGLVGIVSPNLSAAQGLTLAVLLSMYHLVVNLMTDRENIRRCMTGLGIAAGVILLCGYANMIPDDAFDFWGDIRAVAYLRRKMAVFLTGMRSRWGGTQELYLVMLFPFILSWVLYSNRRFSRVASVLMLAADIFLLHRMDSFLAMGCAVLCLVLFPLLYSHKALSGGVVLLPAVISGGVWYTRFFPLTGLVGRMEDVVSVGTGYRSRLWVGVWRMICHHPLGVGLGETAFSAIYPAYADPGMSAVKSARNLYLDILAAWGWPGLIVVVLMTFLLLQKMLSALRLTGRRQDQLPLVSGVCMVMVCLLWGMYRDLSLMPALFFGLCLPMALCSATANVVFDDDSVMITRTAGDDIADDRILR